VRIGRQAWPRGEQQYTPAGLGGAAVTIARSGGIRREMRRVRASRFQLWGVPLRVRPLVSAIVPIAILAPSALAFGQQVAVAGRLVGEPDDAAWSRAAPITAFVQRDPNEGAAPTFATEARVLYDDTAIYVAVKAFDPEPDRIKAFLTRRDVNTSSDWIRVYIDSYYDRRTAYSFAVNPAGVKLDTYHFDDTNEDGSWDAVWDVTIRMEADGWSARFRIPFSQLRFSRGHDGRLGFAIARVVARTNELTTWPLLSKTASGFVSSFGELRGLVSPPAGKRLELVPYTVGELTTLPMHPGNPLHRSPDTASRAGLDLKYAVTPGLTLTATVNPDFGQVEADPAVVNLTAFETLFDERRPFFIEGSGNFSFACRDCNLFYSRRIGRPPRGSPLLADGEFVSRPGESTILGAGKLTGRVGSFSVGSLVAATQEESAQIAFGADRRAAVIEPRTLYSVSRIKREFADQSSVGVILTTTNRTIVDGVTFLPSSAVIGGADFDWRLGSRWQLAGSWAGSRIGGSAGAIERLQRSSVHNFQRPDAGHVELDPLSTRLSGHMGSFGFAKIAGERTRMSVGMGYQSPGFEPNDLGFVQRTDWIPQNSWLQIRWDTPGRYVRNVRLNFNQWAAFNFGGDVLNNGVNVNAHWSFQNQWSSGFGVNGNFRTVDDRRTRGGPGVYTNPGWNAWQYMNTNDRRLVSLAWSSSFGRSPSGYWSFWNAEPAVTVRPASAFSASVGVRYSRSNEDAQWVQNVTAGGRTSYVFAHLDQTTTSMTARVNYTITPALSLEIYAQPFASAGAYHGYKELVQPRADRHADRYVPFAYEGGADFNVLSFRTTNVLRWEYKPGSALFVVWQQGREGFLPRGDMSVSRAFGDVFATPATNTLLVKLAYWINP
jgi:hypothetical protein